MTSEAEQRTELDDDKRAIGRRGIKSEKLNSAMEELESALADWDNLGDESLLPAEPPSSDLVSNEDFQKKNKQLIDRLRDQLKDLSSD